MIADELSGVGGSAMSLTTAQIGRCGELLVQYALLMRGVESAPMSTDAGIDLVAYSATLGAPKTIQVKANLKPKPGGGKGRAALDWWLPHDSPADLIAFVDLSTRRVWLLKANEIAGIAQQSSNGRFHFYMYTDPGRRPSKTGRRTEAPEFDRFLFEQRVAEIFGV